jgi:hypothetical protein
MLAYANNWKGLHAFAYHTKDYKTPQQSEINAFTSMQYLPPFTELAQSQWLGPPPVRKAKVDHRYKEVDYYESTAGFFIDPYGNVIVRSGDGSELRMAGGSIQFSAAGDIWLQPGRNLNVWAGDDIILKAHNSIDATATNHDVRIKAEQHVEVLAGNSGLGRILLDCRALGSNHDVVGHEGEDVKQSGIILKCAKGDVGLLGTNVKLRTGGGDLGSGMIILDADKGKQVVRLVANQVVCHVEFGFNVAMAVEGKTRVHHLGPSVIHAVTGVCMEGGLLVRKNGIQLRGYLVGIECIIVSDLNKSGLIAVHKPGDESWDIVEENLAKCKADFDKMTEAMQKDYDDGVKKYWYDDKRLGNDQVIEYTQYAPRNQAQMGTRDFKLPEVYYQTLAAASGGMAVWVEKVIKYQGKEFMPHPSKEKWADDPEAFRQADFTMHDLTKGIDKDRQGPYLEPTLAKWKRSKLDGAYTVAIS